MTSNRAPLQDGPSAMHGARGAPIAMNQKLPNLADQTKTLAYIHVNCIGIINGHFQCLGQYEVTVKTFRLRVIIRINDVG
jgi:hypothetical protein